MTLDQLPRLEALPRLEPRPPIYGPDLYANHALIPVLWLEIPHALALLDPRVPHDRVAQVVALDVERGHAVGAEDGRGALRYGGVDAVDLAGYGEARVGFRVGCGVEDLVDVGCTEEAGYGCLGYVLRCGGIVLDEEGRMGGKEGDSKGERMHLYGEVGVQQHLELERLAALVAHLQHGAQPGGGQRDAVDEAEGEGPCGAGVGSEVGWAEAKVELDAAALGLGGGLAQVLPLAGAGEAVLLEGRGGMVGGRGAEVLRCGARGRAGVSGC